MTLSNERKTGEDRFRILVVPSGRRFRRWRWTTEEKWHDGWNLKAEGCAFSLIGATDAAHRRAERFLSFDTERVEILLVRAYSYVPSSKEPSPIQAEYVQ